MNGDPAISMLRWTRRLAEAYGLPCRTRPAGIVPLGWDLTVARLVLDSELRVVRIRDNSGTLLRFPSIQEARQFLRGTLGVLRTTVLHA